MTDLSLAAEFPPASREDWRALVERVLKGAPYEGLVSRTRDGRAIEPIYERAAGAQALAPRAPGAPWTVMQRVDHPDPKAANAEALADLTNGATGLALIVAGAPSANGFGLADAKAVTFDRALKDVQLDAIAVRLDAGARDLEAAEALLSVAATRGIAPDKLGLSLGLDTLSTLAGGALGEPVEAALKRRAQVAATLVRGGFQGRAFLADGRPVHDAGGSEAQELAFVLASAVAYWRVLEAADVDLDAGRRQIAFLLAADADQFLSLAKFRILRKLWARVEEAAGLASVPVRLHAETAWRMTTQRDPYVNWLRTTVAVFAAGLAGADSITVLPHSAALGLPDHFARRIARNTQLILQEETSLHRVADPGAGAGAIEALTNELGAAAWKLFQEIEGASGVTIALASGLLQHKVAEVREARAQDVTRRKEPLTGTSEFPDLSEAPVAVLKVKRPTIPKIKAKIEVEALPRLRLSEPFERLRDTADKVSKEKRPKIFLANLGVAADFGERAMFAKSLFEAGGIEALASDGFPTVDTLAAAFKRSKAKIACLCASEALLASQGEPAVRALKDAGAKLVFVAGRPNNETALRAAGADDFVYAGVDTLAALDRAHATLGLKPGARKSRS
jgi:methylmalonyl-CoA mutase